MDRKNIFTLIANNNTVITSVISKLGIFEGSLTTPKPKPTDTLLS